MLGPQLIALLVGLVASVLAAPILYASHVLKKRATARTVELFSLGASSGEIVPQLVAEGFDKQMAASVVRRVVRRFLLAHPTKMLEAGYSQADILKDMMGRGLDRANAKKIIAEAADLLWFRRWRFLLLPTGLALILVGVVVVFLGLILRDGNRSGKWVTFPFAGSMTIMAGVGVLTIGFTIVAKVFGKTDLAR